MLWPKKNSYKEFDNEKKFLRLENPPTVGVWDAEYYEVGTTLAFFIHLRSNFARW